MYHAPVVPARLYMPVFKDGGSVSVKGAACDSLDICTEQVTGINLAPIKSLDIAVRFQLKPYKLWHLS